MRERGPEWQRSSLRVGGDAQLTEQHEIEMSFIRTLSVRGLVLGGPISPADRRERIRVAILAEKLDREPFAENMSFAQAYKLCYNRPLNLRRVARDRHQRPVDVVAPCEDDVFLENGENGAMF